MVIKTASPGVIVNEVDLTKGTGDAITTNVGGMVGPFEKGPVDELVLIETEAELQRTFGDPTPENYEYWYTISNFLEYGGVCYVIRCDDASGGSQTMKNACTPGQAPYVKNKTDFDENYLGSGGAIFLSQTPGTWGNALGVAVIDAGADIYAQLSTTNKTDFSGNPVSDATSFATSVEAGTIFAEYETVGAAAFVAPAPWSDVAVASTSASITLSGEQTIDGVTTSGSRVLVAAQSELRQKQLENRILTL